MRFRLSRKQTKLILKLCTLVIGTALSLNLFLPVAISQPNPTEFPSKINFPSHVLPYPLQTISKTSTCLILNPDNLTNWTPQEFKALELWAGSELWAWHQLCIGEIADFKNVDLQTETIQKLLAIKREITIPPNTLAQQSNLQESDTRTDIIQSKNFLEIILKREPFRSALPEKLSIANVSIGDKINLNSSTIQQELEFKAVTFQEDVNLFKTNFRNAISFVGEESEDNIKKVEFKGGLFLNNSKFDKKVKIDQAQFIPKESTGKFISLNLSNTVVNDDLDLKNITFDVSSNQSRKLPLISLESATIEQSLVLKNIDVEGLAEAGGDNNYLQTKGLSVNKSLVFSDDFNFSCQTNNAVCNGQVNLNGINVNKLTFTVAPKTDSEKEEVSYLNNQNIVDLGDTKANIFQIVEDSALVSKAEDIVVSENDDQISAQCWWKLDGFQYQALNYKAFYSIEKCIKTQYSQGNGLADPSRFSIDRSDLIQPYEQLAEAANSLGLSDKQREFLYTTQKIQSYGDRHPWLNFLSFLQDWFYGFGYKRDRVFLPMILLFVIGFCFSYYVLCRKQEKIIKEATQSSLTELRDERLLDQEIQPDPVFCRTISLSRLNPYVDSIDRVIFVKPEKQSSQTQFDIYLALPDGSARTQLLKDCEITDFSGSYFHLLFNTQKQLQIFLDSLTLRNPQCVKVGLCPNLFGVPEMAIPGVAQDFLENRRVSAEVKNNFHFYTINRGESLSFKKFQIAPKLVTFVKISISIIVCVVLININWRFANPIFLANLIVAVGLGFLMVLLLIDFLRTRRSPNLKLRRIGSVTIHSIDLMFPIISLDEDLGDFIFDASKELDGGWIRAAKIYFLTMKIVSGILAGIWIPILFSTGL